MSGSIGIILARGSSKRLPRKNVKPLLGTPLIGWMIRAALASRLDRVIVSTEDAEIAEIARAQGADVPFRRPDDLATDYASSDAILKHALDTVAAQEGRRYDVCVTLQPTTPFVEPADIDGCLAALARNPDVQTCFTAREVKEFPSWMFVAQPSGRVSLYEQGAIEGEREHSQLVRRYVIPNGAAYATRVEALVRLSRVICDPAMVHRMSAERSVDVDDPFDWVIAEAIGAHAGFHPSQAARAKA
jgi:CMP-N,N'-diacetyllegionaminic acid synthase